MFLKILPLICSVGINFFETPEISTVSSENAGYFFRSTPYPCTLVHPPQKNGHRASLCPSVNKFSAAAAPQHIQYSF